MITLLKDNGRGFYPVEDLQDGVWVRVIDPGSDEQEDLKERFQLDDDVLSDMLDADEQSRIEKEDDGLTCIIRLPIFAPDREVPYFTVPFGIIVRTGVVITVSLFDNPIAQDMLHRRIRGIDLFKPHNLILNTILRSALYYMRYLKDINRRTTTIERDLHGSVKNADLTQLLHFQKSFVFFNTSLRSNELLLEKINKLSAWQLNEDEQETLEDARIELKQAIEMAKIYSNILSGMVDTFSSVVANNLNQVMKRLTLVNLTLMIPTLLASLYGMNVTLPFQEQSWAFWGILAVAVTISISAWVIFRVKKLF